MSTTEPAPDLPTEDPDITPDEEGDAEPMPAPAETETEGDQG